jgi:preprotein translocase subunit YajC
MNQGSNGGTLLLFLLPLALLGWLFWTQRRRQRQFAATQSAMSVGDEVCTTSGLFGRIADLTDSVATLEVSPGVRLRFDRRALALKVPSSSGAGQPPAPTDSSGQ